MKRDLITKHPLLPESKHMLYCTYTPHLLYLQAHIILMHTESHLLHSVTRTYWIHVAHRLCFEVEDSLCIAPMCFGHWTCIHVCTGVIAHIHPLEPHTLLQKCKTDRNGLFVPSLWPIYKRIRIDYSCPPANINFFFPLRWMFCFQSLPFLSFGSNTKSHSCTALYSSRHIVPNLQRVHDMLTYMWFIYCINFFCLHTLLWYTCTKVLTITFKTSGFIWLDFQIVCTHNWGYFQELPFRHHAIS